MCLGNCCRSQMAEGLARKIAPQYEIYSAGLLPAGFVSSQAISVMQEEGIEIGDQESKGLDAVDVDQMDVIVAMGGFPAADFVPRPQGKLVQEWDIEDPIGRDIGFYRKTRAQLADKITRLLAELEGEFATKPQSHGGS